MLIVKAQQDQKECKPKVIVFNSSSQLHLYILHISTNFHEEASAVALSSLKILTTPLMLITESTVLQL